MGWNRLIRMHGSPRKYWSNYTGQSIHALARAFRDAPQAAEIWCVFDNTASGAALENAWELYHLLLAGGCRLPGDSVRTKVH